MQSVSDTFLKSQSNKVLAFSAAFFAGKALNLTAQCGHGPAAVANVARGQLEREEEQMRRSVS